MQSGIIYLLTVVKNSIGLGSLLNGLSIPHERYGVVVSQFVKTKSHKELDDSLDVELVELEELDSSLLNLNGICNLYEEHPRGKLPCPSPPFHSTVPPIPLEFFAVTGIVFGHPMPYMFEESSGNPPTRAELLYGGPAGLLDDLYM